MKLSDLQEELSKDVPIDQTKLVYEAANSPVVYSKWAIKFSNAKKEITALEAKKKKLLKAKLDYYSGRGDEISMDRYERSEMKTVLSGDQEILKIDTAIEYWQIILNFIGDAMDTIKSRGFAIKHIIDIRSFEEGR